MNGSCSEKWERITLALSATARDGLRWAPRLRAGPAMTSEWLRALLAYLGLEEEYMEINSQGCLLLFPSWGDISFVSFMDWIKLNINLKLCSNLKK